jgi:NAD(P)-dependent dehydrogenase (short-subunit alcohol dehydrogenase family)
MLGKIALVSGAGAGIGRAIATRLAWEGAAVVIADVSAGRGRRVVSELRRGGGQAAFVRADVGVEEDVQAMIAFAERRFGGLDILVNNAGIAPPPYFPQAASAHWGRTLDVNLHGTMLAIHYALPAMGKRGGGVVVNISSMAGMLFCPYDAPEYAASKAGIVHLTAALGSLNERSHVRVNCICPGWVETEAVRRSLAKTSAEERAGMDFPPPALLIQPEQIAELVVMFVRDDSLAGRVVVWPDGEPWRMVPVSSYQLPVDGWQ